MNPSGNHQESCDMLVRYVHEYLLLSGAPKAAQIFLTELKWEKDIPLLGEPPGFLHSWWCLFYDLYYAAPERRNKSQSSNEAKQFYDSDSGLAKSRYGEDDVSSNKGFASSTLHPKPPSFDGGNVQLMKSGGLIAPEFQPSIKDPRHPAGPRPKLTMPQLSSDSGKLAGPFTAPNTSSKFIRLGESREFEGGLESYGEDHEPFIGTMCPNSHVPGREPLRNISVGPVEPATQLFFGSSCGPISSHGPGRELPQTTGVASVGSVMPPVMQSSGGPINYHSPGKELSQTTDVVPVGSSMLPFDGLSGGLISSHGPGRELPQTTGVSSVGSVMPPVMQSSGGLISCYDPWREPPKSNFVGGNNVEENVGPEISPFLGLCGELTGPVSSSPRMREPLQSMTNNLIDSIFLDDFSGNP